jgi:hypothetical protein
MEYERRPATREEVIAAFTRYKGQKVLYDHWLIEQYAPNAKLGVRIVRQSSRPLFVEDGIPKVKHHGEWIEVKAEHFTLPDGQTFVACATIKEGVTKP